MIELNFSENGLIPAIVQDEKTGQVLMVAYMNKQSYDMTLKSGKATFFSRSRQEIWEKGNTSGNYMLVSEIYFDCDMDAILLKVKAVGPACHTGKNTCFYRKLQNDNLVECEDQNVFTIFEEVYKVIKDRKINPKEGSYTNYLLDKGIDKVLKKVGEETSEVIIGAKNEGSDELRYEIADLVYHLSVLMVQKDLTWDDICSELKKRR